MSYHRVAYGKGVNQRGATRYVVLYKHTSGTDLGREFHLGPDGFRESYEGPSQTALMPGIWTQKLEVTTIWENPSELESVLSDIATGADGLFFMQVRTDITTTSRQGTPFYVILPEAISVADDAENVQATFVGTDGLAMLRDVKYNNAGNPYTDHQTIKQHIENVQSKHLLFDVAQSIGASYGAASRLRIAESNISVDDEFYSAYPPGTSSGTPKRMRVHHRTFHKQGQDGVNEYFSAYDVLESICLTLNLAVSIQDCYLIFWTVVTDYGNNSGRRYNWNGTESAITSYEEDYHFNGSFTYFGQVYKNIKGANWTRTFLPPAGDVRLIRNTQGDQGVIYATNVAPNTQLFDANEVYESGDLIAFGGSIRIINDNDYTYTGRDRFRRLVPAFTITIKDANDVVYYYTNTVTPTEILAATTLTYNTAGNTEPYPEPINFAELRTGSGNWSTTAGNYHHNKLFSTTSGYAHDANQNFDIVVHFSFKFNRGLPDSIGPFTDLTITPKLTSVDAAGSFDTAYTASLTTTFINIGGYRYDNGEVQATSKFTHRAHTNTGRTEIDLGETLIGDRGAKTYFGGIEVYDGTDWVASSGWVNQEQSTPRTINQIVVEEVCAFHKRSKILERGSLVGDGQYQYFYIGNAFKDVASGSRYAMLSMTRVFTPAIDEVVLVKVGRNMLDITAVQEGKGTDAITTYAKPNNDDAVADMFGVASDLGGISQTYHNEARLIFGNNWSSVIGADETQEYYVTYNIDGQGIRVDHQGETPTVGTNIQRRIYFNQQALASPSTSPPWAALHSTYQPPEGFTLQGTIDRLLSAHYATVGTNGRASYLVTYSEVSTSFLLDDFSEYQAAYSLRKLRQGYTGDAIRVQRASDSALQDIGFDSNGELDTTALSNFAAGGTLTVRTWYDQGASGYDLTQISVSAQPTIVASGQTVTVNGKPAVDFDGSNDFMARSNVSLNASPRTVFTFAAVFQLDTVSAGGYVASAWSGTQSNQLFQLLSQSTAQIRFAARFQNGTLSTVQTGANSTAANTQYVGVGQFKANHSKGVFNGTDFSGTNVNSTVNHATTSLAFGHRSDSGSGKFNGKLQEFVAWSQITASAAHDRDAISQAIDDHYGIY